MKEHAVAAPAGRQILELALPPKTAAQRPWWLKYWDDPLRKRDRVLFA